MVDMVENIMEAARTVTRTVRYRKGLRGAAGAAQQRAGPAPARGRKRPPPPPRPGLARPQGPGHRVDGRGIAGAAGVRPPFSGRPSGPASGRVDVEAEHLLDDYWWVTATPAGTDPDDAAMAVVRIRDSKDRLRYGAGYSARIS